MPTRSLPSLELFSITVKEHFKQYDEKCTFQHGSRFSTTVNSAKQVDSNN